MSAAGQRGAGKQGNFDGAARGETRRRGAVGSSRKDRGRARQSDSARDWLSPIDSTWSPRRPGGEQSGRAGPL